MPLRVIHSAGGQEGDLVHHVELDAGLRRRAVDQGPDAVAGKHGALLAGRWPVALCRDDQHVAWRADRARADAAALVELLRGAPPQALRLAA